SAVGRKLTFSPPQEERDDWDHPHTCAGAVAVRPNQIGSARGADPGMHTSAELSAELVELGQATLARIADEAARGTSLLRCQLIAAPFYDALRRSGSDHSRMQRAAARSASLLVDELRATLKGLGGDREDDVQRPTPRRPVLRVITGGRA